ncbi:MAG: PBP1A family penicillin-binding protein [Desulfurivibrionaceae bacterium]|nr:PBP1A family penicillin-binding protein [Desulfurivibrionaceae bacterium]
MSSRPLPQKSSSPTRIWHWNHFQLSIFLLGTAFLLSAFITVLLFLFVTLNIPALDSLTDYQPKQTSIIKDREGLIVDRAYTENRIVVPLAAMPDLLPKAFIAAEDARFLEHGGVDTWSIARALVNNIKAGGRSQGGSTITQQVARALLLSREKTYLRKIKEAILAYRIDQVLSKKDVLHIYLNQIYLGEKSYGVEAAAFTYFGKKAAELSLAEIAILAGLPQAPSRYSPFHNYGAAKKRQGYVLNRMAEEGFISSSAASKAFDQPLLWASRPNNHHEALYFLQAVRNDVSKRYGRKMLYEGGLTIETTLDLRLQKEADRSIEKGVSNWALRSGHGRRITPQGALVAMESRTGKVRALTGGVNFSRSQFNRATQAKRQPGSAFKPLVFAQAFSSGLSPASVFIDAPLHLPGHRKGVFWEPKNFSGTSYGPTTLSTALVKSRNIVTIKLLQEIGIQNVILLARQMGIKSSLHPNLSLALGASELSLLELTAAYTTFANQGKYCRPIFINRIFAPDGRVLENNIPRQNKVLDERAAYQVTRLLQDVIREGTGKKAWGLAGDSAGKTGTADQNMDAWFIGYTPDLVTGVWMGFDLKRNLGKNETGGQASAPIWFDFMKKAMTDRPPEKFQVPAGITFLPTDRETGLYDPEMRNKKRWLPFWTKDIEKQMPGKGPEHLVRK